jgi:hypothetical protein
MNKKRTNVPMQVHTCSICQRDYHGYGHNAYPINEGRCCDGCNTLVIIARINAWHVRRALENHKE